MIGITSRDVIDPDLQAVLAQMEWQETQPNPVREILEPGAATQGLGDDAYAGRPGFYPRGAGR